MKLHNNEKEFINLIRIVSNHYNIDPSLVEKDYYVTLILKELVKSVPNIVFKGGTSLSKCYKLINRFSEDIDLTLNEKCLTQGQKRHLKKEMINVCEKIKFDITNIEEIRSRRNFNCYKIEYPIKYPSTSIKPLLLVETTYISKAYPSEVRQATSIIYDYLLEKSNLIAVEKYELFPFDINVQSLERTLIDKVFAICDYMIDGRTERLSRHIYDLSRLVTVVKLDENLKELMIRVREERKDGIKSYSAKENININELLQKIIDTKYYKKDYENATEILLSKVVSYNEAISAIQKIIDSKVFEI
ncbi:MAG: nucleotidyl transferase AbiEii/AbiGii toxin family protein [Bacilli bacterium]|nr:nucleotidyl transferase AbiEii/AbiGii toxin family protein [Bacilli bacterium]